MRKLAGYVFDTYDDVDGQVLRSLVPSTDDLPDFVKTASRLTEDQVNKVSDDHFALVMVDQGVKMKKYATVDKGNTVLSVMYLLKQAHLLPPLAVKIAAGNLIDACQHHQLAVPAQLKLAAETGLSPVSGKSQRPYKNLKVSHIQFPNTETPNESTTNPQLGRHDAANADVDQRTNLKSIQGTNMLEVPPFPQKEKIKTAMALSEGNPLGRGLQWSKGGPDMQGESATVRAPEIKPFGAKEKNSFLGGLTPPGLQMGLNNAKKTVGGIGSAIGSLIKAAAPEGSTVVTKQKSWRQSPYVDMTGWDPAAVEAFEAKPAQQTLLDGVYPVDGYDQVKTASAYFEENWREFPPRKRHEYCVGLVERMEKLGMEIPEDVERYGSTTYASDVDAYVAARRSYAHEEFHPALDLLLEKRAQVSPETFAEALSEFDHISNLHYHWDAQVADPWRSTFGPSLEKIAEKEWCYDEQGIRIDEALLKHFAANGHGLIVKTWGADFAKEFQKSPKTFFMALPAPNKLLVARAAATFQEG
jgi:hypothetical protein